MTIYFTSDLHLGHSRIILYANRNFSDVHEMNEALIRNWNAVVKPDDIVWNLGDFSFQTFYAFNNTLHRLNGKINMVLGNHDKMLIENKTRLLEDGKIVSMQDYHKLKINGEQIIMSHYSFRVWDRSHAGSIALFGHSHGTLPPHGKSVDVGVDCKEITNEYRPVSLDEVLTYMSKRKFEPVDHHGRHTK